MIAVILTVHNRKAKTISCLKALFGQKKANPLKFDVFLTDDGCTDGTAEEVKALFPEVYIIKGDGSLFWNRGMYRAWEAASKTKSYDFYLWLNDDTLLFENAVQEMINASKNASDKAIICGATSASDKTVITYSGRNTGSNKRLVPNGQLQECNIINGNFVLIPKAIFDVIGNLDWRFRHAIGDFDYGLRAQQKGFKCYVAPRPIGICESNPSLPKWCLTTTPVIQRFQLLYSPLGYAEPIPFFLYEKRHFGVVKALKHFASINLRALLPALWK